MQRQVVALINKNYPKTDKNIVPLSSISVTFTVTFTGSHQ